MHKIKLASVDDHKMVTEMVVQLLTELRGTSFEKKPYIYVAKELLESCPGYSVFLAVDEADRCIGLLSVMECCSIYADGRFGIIQELYVLPAYRSSQLGYQLINTVKKHAQQNKWLRLEVGAPDAIKWKRTVDFYKREGFREIGPRLTFRFIE